MTNEEIKEYCDNNQKKVEQYCDWLLYQIGLSGVGTTALDKEPNFSMPKDIPQEITQAFIEMAKEEAKFRWNCWCEAAHDIDEYCVPENWKCPEIG
jgi:hypothetical protein